MESEINEQSVSIICIFVHVCFEPTEAVASARRDWCCHFFLFVQEDCCNKKQEAKDSENMVYQNYLMSLI